MPAIGKQFQLDPGYIVHLTSAVQFGFITGTLLFAILGVADRFSPSLVFFVSALIAGCINLVIVVPGLGTTGLLSCRFLTGFFLAGIYPVGMKIAADHYRQGLGKSLGFLVGALVLGTSFPHFLKAISHDLPWRYLVYTTSALSLLGGLAMWLLVPDGPDRQAAQPFRFDAFWKGFANKNFRAAALGYFGHMWELYAFWVFVPVMLTAYQQRHPAASLNISLLSFIIIAAGGVACVLSGLLSGSFGVKRTATGALLISCICCLTSPLMLFIPSPAALIIFLFIWGMAVIADSPMFSTLVAQNAPASAKGSSLTIVNCIGFATTIISIQLINAWRNEANEQYIYLLLAIGPIAGLTALLRNKD